MMIGQEFLDLLRCPESQQPLSLADAGLVEALNRAIAEGKLRNRSGEVVTDAVEGALVREDRTLAYPIVDEIPILLEDEAIPLAQLESNPAGNEAAEG